ncbi:PAS domain S-box protein [Desulfovibrio inopinatus]|uniref:PAS domain S-box protein n=1 Tax=Desulfovibrio inopinatus TaxID=102109 RepID=UPI000401A773|nr:PAS domain S-box protein [Desulfovibrio inopinatus]
MRVLLPRIGLSLVLLAYLVLPSAGQDYRHVLILHSYHPGMIWVENMDRAIRDELQLPPHENIIIHTEYMDTKHHQSPEFYNRLIRIYKEKYQNMHLDLIMATDNNAFEFLLKYKQDIFNDTPVVFGGVNNFFDKSIEGREDFTGIAETISLRETVEVILKHFPDTKEIYVINDYLNTGRAWYANILRDQKPFEDRIRFIHNPNISLPELKATIQSLKAGTVVLLGAYYADRDGNYLTYEKTGALLTEDSLVPVYCLARIHLKANVIGGKLVTGYEHGRRIADIGRHILGGGMPKDIPVVKIGANLFIFNWLGMERYGISRKDLPTDSVIINEPYSFYRENRTLFWIGVGIIAVLFLLVLMLSWTIVKLRSSRKKLMHSERKYRSIFDNAIEGIFQVTLEGKTLAANLACATMYGYDSPEEFITSVTDSRKDIYVNPSDREAIIRRVRQERRVAGIEVQVKHRDGHTMWVSFNIREALDPNGEVILEGSLIDITERKKAESELTRMRKYLADILDAMPSVLVGVDQNGRVTMLNHTAEQCAGTTSRRALGKNLIEIFPWLESLVEMIQESISQQTSRYASKVLRHHQGEARYENITIFPLNSDISKEAVVRVDNVSRNVQMEKMMVQSEKMMSIGGLAAGMAHEINNPLAGVIGYAHNMKKRLSGDLRKNRVVAEECGVTLEAINEYLEKRDITSMLKGISESGERAAHIVSNMLDFSRKSEPSGATRNSITDLLDQAVELASNVYDMQRQFDFRSVKVIREYADDLPEVVCDGNEMQQVFLNLLKNGAEAMAEKNYNGQSPTFILRAYRKNNTIVSEIEDNGPGMPEHIRNRILEPFFTTKAVGKGTGLGLSVSYFIVTDLHKGSMNVESKEGEWTRFTIELPLVQEVL